MDLLAKSIKIWQMIMISEGLVRKYRGIWEEYRRVQILSLLFIILAGICLIAAFLACPSDNPLACGAAILLGAFFAAFGFWVLMFRAKKLRGKLEEALGK